MAIEVRPLEHDIIENWDKTLMQCPDWSVYQTEAWLDFIQQTQSVSLQKLGIYDGDEIKGIWAGADIRKGPFRLFGSPMKGWTTAYMGPASNGLDSLELLDVWQKFLKKNGYHHAQMCHPAFTDQTAKQAGLQVERGECYESIIPQTEEEILAMFKKSCREAIRKSVRHGVEVEMTDDPAFVDHFYYHLEDVFGKQGLLPTFPKSRIQVLWRTMKPTGRLITIWAKHEGKVVGTEISIIGNKILHAYGWASLRSAQKHSPNEAVQLLALKIAAQKGCVRHEVCGAGSYKKKYGAHPEPVYNLLFYSNGLMPIARQLYAKIFNLRQKRKGVGTAMPPRPALEVDFKFST